MERSTCSALAGSRPIHIGNLPRSTLSLIRTKPCSSQGPQVSQRPALKKSLPRTGWNSNLRDQARMDRPRAADEDRDLYDQDRSTGRRPLSGCPLLLARTEPATEAAIPS